MGPVVQIIGSLLVLAGFVLAQRGVLRPTSLVYLSVNLAGSGVLAVDAALGRQWGFLLLEGVWAIVSAAGLVAALGRRTHRVESAPTRESGAPD
jgi:hypothetical protein